MHKQKWIFTKKENPISKVNLNIYLFLKKYVLSLVPLSQAWSLAVIQINTHYLNLFQPIIPISSKDSPGIF